jgi:hypothetical protein
MHRYFLQVSIQLTPYRSSNLAYMGLKKVCWGAASTMPPSDKAVKTDFTSSGVANSRQKEILLPTL